MNESEEVGKKIRIVTKNNFHYTGQIIDENEKTLLIIDKFGKKITIAKDSILICEEE